MCVGEAGHTAADMDAHWYERLRVIVAVVVTLSTAAVGDAPASDCLIAGFSDAAPALARGLAVSDAARVPSSYVLVVVADVVASADAIIADAASEQTSTF